MKKIFGLLFTFTCLLGTTLHALNAEKSSCEEPISTISAIKSLHQVLNLTKQIQNISTRKTMINNLEGLKDTLVKAMATGDFTKFRDRTESLYANSYKILVDCHDDELKIKISDSLKNLLENMQ